MSKTLVAFFSANGVTKKVSESLAKVAEAGLFEIVPEQVPVFNVTFEPGCRNNWHIHHAKNCGGQMLICIGGRGYYQEWGKDAVEMTPGKVINIPATMCTGTGKSKHKYIIFDFIYEKPVRLYVAFTKT